MDERLFAHLAARVAHGPVVLARVLATRGATPRKAGSRMLIDAQGSIGSVGGGAAEARVIGVAQAMLQASSAAQSQVEIDLTGRPGADGICGGAMRVALRRWHGDADLACARRIAAALARGECVQIVEDARSGAVLAQAAGMPAAVADAARVDEGSAGDAQRLHPDARLLIFGAGHCALALYDLARHLDFDLWVFDTRAACFDDGQFAQATTRSGGFASIAEAFDTQREIYAVLLNREFPGDVATLRVLADRPMAFLGMMGSRKRIAQVRAALPELEAVFERMHAPVGIELDAQTPHEIAVSILAQVIGIRSAARADLGAASHR